MNQIARKRKSTDLYVRQIPGSEVHFCSVFPCQICMGLYEIYSYALLTKREVKMTGYWSSSFNAFLWTETLSRSVKTQTKNEVNIQPSWPNKLCQENIYSTVDLKFLFHFLSSSLLPAVRGENESINKHVKRESSRVSTYSYMVHELITEVEWSHRGLEMQYPRFKKCISKPANYPTYKSADSLVKVFNLVYDLLTPSWITQVLRYHFFSKSVVLKSLSQWYMERYWSAYSLFCQLSFASNCSSV